MMYHDRVEPIAEWEVVKSSDPDTLADIYDDTVAMAIWQRSLGDVSEYAALLVSQPLPFSFQAQGNAEQMRGLLNRMLPESTEKATFVEDIVLLVDMFACLFDLDEVGVRLGVLSRAMCPRFHVDKIPCRLVSTYFGAGSEWLHDRDVERHLVGQVSQAANLSSGLRQEGQIHRLHLGDVALMKGDTWPTRQGRGVVHRSPPASADDKRLFLSLDMI